MRSIKKNQVIPLKRGYSSKERGAEMGREENASIFLFKPSLVSEYFK